MNFLELFEMTDFVVVPVLVRIKALSYFAVQIWRA
jgi:hypothetical protein